MIVLRFPSQHVGVLFRGLHPFNYDTAQPGTYTFESHKENMVYRFTPYVSGEKMQPDVVASAEVVQGNAPSTVLFRHPQR
ncbi:hypothetical protein HQ585_05650 [candidate division KSB1 bacterium]|nr:hypothetical protein [candidate division KSB1 bacterium]